MHNRSMQIVLTALLLLMLAALPGTGIFAQEPQHTGDQDGSSQQVEESDEAFRRRMELEDARNRDPTYTDPANTYRRELEKIDKLPPESRENIRDQLVDIIMENPDWKPGDALEEYPYEPTTAAQADPDLMQREQEAWDEQIEKYHAREAEAFGAYRGKAGGPGNPDGQEGEDAQQGQQGSQGGQGQQGGEEGQNGQQGQQGGQPGSQSRSQAGTYQPQNGSSEEADSTEGVSESALDFLRNRQAGGQPGQQSSQPASNTGQQQAQTTSQASEQNAAEEQAQPEQAQQSEDAEQPTDPDMRGIIAIEDLYKLEGTGDGRIPVPPPEEEKEDDPDKP
jgi:hypothetical protein